MMFFFMWTWFFGRFYDILGVDSSEGDYQGLFRSGRYFMQTYENSIGNINSPSYKFWDSQLDNVTAHLVVLTIWLVWFLNQWFIFMVLLNFVIALIS